MACFELEWWAYLSFVFSFFVLCLGLNYVVKKINEAKIEERFIRMLQKASTTQSTQVNGPLIAVETAKTTQQFSPPGISLVFNQEENRRRTDPYNLILKPVKEKKFEVSSLNAYKSMETVINIISIPSDDRIVNNNVSIKKIESERAANKATSSHILTEKVLVKNNGFGRRAVKENSSITTKSDSYVTELITVKKNEYGHVAGIGSLPFTRKDCNSSVLVSENETGRIIFPKSSPSIHIDNVIQDETAKESALREESVRIKAEGTTSNKTNDSVAENVPLTNIYAGRMVTTNASSIVEDTVKKPTVLADKKSNEEIDSGCFIKKSVDSIMSKIVKTSKNEDLLRVKSAKYVSESSRNINEISYVEKKECSSSAAKETSRIQSDRVGENVTVKKGESGPIVAKETSIHARIQRQVKELFPVKMSVSIKTANSTPIRTQSDITVSKYFPIKRSESGSIAARRKDSLLLQESSYTRSDDNVAELSVVRSDPSSLKKPYFVKKTKDSTVIANTSKTTNDNPVKKVPFTDKIKALLEDENVVDIVLYEPSSSTKK